MNESINIVPLEIVSQIPEKIKTLKLGMSEKEVFESLGISSYPIVCGWGGGPLYKHSTSYHLREGFNLILTFDTTDKTGKKKFVRAKLISKNSK